MTKRLFKEGQKVKYINDEGEIKFGFFSSYGTVLGGLEAVYANWGNRDYPTWIESHRVESATLESSSETNINQDIIKLIESGYEFKTFWGTTFDGKEFHIETQGDEEVPEPYQSETMF